MTDLVLHIGPHKTGSTSIQQTLTQNRKLLQKHGVLYFADDIRPAECLAALYATPQQRAQPELLRLFGSDPRILEWSKRTWDELENTIAGTSVDLCILSSEHFFSLKDIPAFVEHLRTIFSQITVIAYAREPAQLYLSNLQQNIRGGRRLHKLRTPASYNYPMRRRLSSYVDAVGQENVVVRSFDRANLRNGDVVSDFIAQMERFGKHVAVTPTRANEAFSGAVIAWLLTVNETWDRASSLQERATIMRRLQRSKELAALPPLMLDNPLFVRILRHKARGDLTWLNRKFLSGQVPLPVEDTPMSPEDIPSDEDLRIAMREWIMSYLTPQSLRLIASEMIAVTP